MDDVSDTSAASVAAAQLDHTYAAATQTASKEVAEQTHSQLVVQPRASFTVRKIIALPKSAAFISTDRKVRLYTGLPNKASFYALFSLLNNRATHMRYWRGAKRFAMPIQRNFRGTPSKSGPTKSLSAKDEFVLTQMKLRLALSNEFLATIFSISSSTCSNIVNTWIKFLSTQLKCLIFWPNKEEIRCYMPKSLKAKYPNLRCTIDCSETFIERPQDLKLQACTWSDYKQYNTLKYLVCITPDGMVSFISRAWGGRTTDRHIVQQSGFLDLLEPYDLVLADRGFTIREDLLFRNCTLEIPPPSAGLQQMCRQNVIKTKEIANARIHVERAINRLKWFKILSTTLLVAMIPLFDDILHICAAMCNLHKPLVW